MRSQFLWARRSASGTRRGVCRSVWQLAHLRSYDALAILGFSDTGFEQVLDDAERASSVDPTSCLERCRTRPPALR